LSPRVLMKARTELYAWEVDVHIENWIRRAGIQYNRDLPID